MTDVLDPRVRNALERVLWHLEGKPRISQAVLNAHAEFGGDLVAMLKAYEAPEIADMIRAVLPPPPMTDDGEAT